MGVGVGWGGMLKFMLRWWCYADHGGWGGWGGWGGMLKFMLRWWCYADHGGWGGWGGWGGMLKFMLRWWCYADHGGWGGWGGWGGMLTFMLRWWCYADHGGWGGWGGWGGMLTFMLRWWCYADHRTFWLSCSDGTQGRPCWKQLALLCRRHLARVEDKKTLIFGKTVCSSRRANGICENEVQTHGKNGTFWTQVPSRPFKYINCKTQHWILEAHFEVSKLARVVNTATTMFKTSQIDRCQETIHFINRSKGGSFQLTPNGPLTKIGQVYI